MIIIFFSSSSTIPRRRRRLRGVGVMGWRAGAAAGDNR